MNVLRDAYSLRILSISSSPADCILPFIEFLYTSGSGRNCPSTSLLTSSYRWRRYVFTTVGGSPSACLFVAEMQ